VVGHGVVLLFLFLGFGVQAGVLAQQHGQVRDGLAEGLDQQQEEFGRVRTCLRDFLESG